jgi:Uma2 family endonuclease
MTAATSYQATQALERTPPPEPLTYNEFLAWADEDTYAEWVNGKVVFMSPVSREHATVSEFLLTLIRTFTETRKAGEAHSDPFQMKTGPDLPGRAPDVLFVATENLARIKQHFLEGPADLVVEVISPESRGRDRGEKFYEYEQGGVKEYWLLDPERRRAEFYRLGSDGYYQLVALGPEGRFESTVLPGLWLKVSWLWQRPPPTLTSVLKEWRVL